MTVGLFTYQKNICLADHILESTLGYVQLCLERPSVSNEKDLLCFKRPS